jgi:hypothetical protein
MKTGISIPGPLFIAPDRLAKKMGLSWSERHRGAVKAHLRKHQRRAGAEALNDVHEGDIESRRLDPTLELLQDSSLREEEWYPVEGKFGGLHCRCLEALSLNVVVPSSQSNWAHSKG